MESHSAKVEPRKENARDREAFERTFPPREGSSPTIVQWSEENPCYIVNGIEAAIPISEATPVPATNNETPTQAPANSGMRRPRKKNKINRREEEYVFQLLKFPNAGEKYLVEIHEKKTGGIERYQVLVNKFDGKWKVGVQDLVPGDHAVVRVLQDPTTPIFNKTYDLPLEDRLKDWSKEKTQGDKGKQHKLYIHRERKFRSFVEVIKFVIYSCNGKDLKSTTGTSQEVHKIEAVEEMVTITSSYIARNPFRN